MIHFQYTEYLIALAAIPLMILLYVMLIQMEKKISKKNW